MFEFQDRVAIITGGASGIGLGIAKAIVGEGAIAVLADLRPDHLVEAKRWFDSQGLGEKVLPAQVDVTDRAAMARLADDVERRFGRIDILVNNAGVGLQGPYDKVELADWDFGLGVNLGGVVNGLQAFIPRIKKSGRGGYVLNVSSLAGLAPPPSDLVIYSAAKAAVIGLSESLADNLAQDKIGISVMCPGLVRSNIHQLAQNRPEQFSQSRLEPSEAPEQADRRAQSASWISAETAGKMAVDGMKNGSRYIITHADHREAFEKRSAAILAAWPKAN